MPSVPFYIADVFANAPYQGNQLAVFTDLNNALSTEQMQRMAREINFAETSFIKADLGGGCFQARIFTPEHEVPFAGHPTLGTAFVIHRFLGGAQHNSLVLRLAHADIPVSLHSGGSLWMQQAQPEFRGEFVHAEVSAELGIPLEDIDTTLPIQEITTGLPYILIPLRSLAAMERLHFEYSVLKAFLYKRQKYRHNSPDGHSVSFFFFTKNTYETSSDYNTRMILLENGRVSEDAATGSANGCFLAYLLQHSAPQITATIEQGFQMQRPSYIYLQGRRGTDFQLLVGGHCQLISEGQWYI